jgi:hypothetical protein
MRVSIRELKFGFPRVSTLEIMPLKFDLATLRLQAIPLALCIGGLTMQVCILEASCDHVCGYKQTQCGHFEEQQEVSCVLTSCSAFQIPCWEFLEEPILYLNILN